MKIRSCKRPFTEAISRFYDINSPDLDLELRTLIESELTGHNYATVLTDDKHYEPHPLKLPPGAADNIRESIAKLTRRNTNSHRDMLYCQHVRIAVEDAINDKLTDHEFHTLTLTGEIGEALIQLGYDTKAKDLPTKELNSPSEGANYYAYFFSKRSILKAERMKSYAKPMA